MEGKLLVGESHACQGGLIAFQGELLVDKNCLAQIFCLIVDALIQLFILPA